MNIEQGAVHSSNHSYESSLDHSEGTIQCENDENCNTEYTGYEKIQKRTSTERRKLMKKRASKRYRVKQKERISSIHERIDLLRNKNADLKHELDSIQNELIIMFAVLPLLSKCNKK